MMSQTLHAGCIVMNSSGLLILGTSGAGKSALAIDLIGRGATLVADDRTILNATNGHLLATCPPSIKGLIEARQIGLLRAPTQPNARVTLVVDLDTPEPDRLPPRRKITILGVEVDLVFGNNTPNLAAALHLWLLGGREE